MFFATRSSKKRPSPSWLDAETVKSEGGVLGTRGWVGVFLLATIRRERGLMPHSGMGSLRDELTGCAVPLLWDRLDPMS